MYTGILSLRLLVETRFNIKINTLLHMLRPVIREDQT
jgi:hypothetical protein